MNTILVYGRKPFTAAEEAFAKAKLADLRTQPVERDTSFAQRDDWMPGFQPKRGETLLGPIEEGWKTVPQLAAALGITAMVASGYVGVESRRLSEFSRPHPRSNKRKVYLLAAVVALRELGGRGAERERRWLHARAKLKSLSGDV